MADMTDAQFRQKVIDVLNEKGGHIKGDIAQVTSIDSNVILPGYEADEDGNPVRYVCAPMTVYARYAQDAAAAIQEAWQVWFSDDTSGVMRTWEDFYLTSTEEWETLKEDAISATNAANLAASGAQQAIDAAAEDHSRAVTDHNTASSDHTTAQGDHSTAVTDHTRAESDHTAAAQDRSLAANDHTRAESDHSTASSDHSRAESDHTRAESDHSTASTDHTTAQGDHATAASDHTQATSDHTASVEATEEAGNVDATLDGMTVTITDRNGQSRSTNIGFEIYRTYASIAAMNADAANVPQGKFVMIATTDPTSVENARLYAKNSAGGFTFLSDLDQASSEAWADWLENHKPLIEADHATAQADHSTAVSDHTRAESDHTTATTDHTTATTDHTQAVADSERAATDHTRAEGDHSTAGTDHTRAEGDHTTAVDDHGIAEDDHEVALSDHSTAASDHTTAEADHGIAEDDHGIATSDHTQAGTDHTRAEGDHATAVTDHTTAESDTSRAGTDHTRAETDHATASSDHSQAGTDHTRAENDHTVATSDHTQADTDHTRAVEDHSTAGTDHTRAENDHTVATSDHTQATGDHETSVAQSAYAKDQGDYAKNLNDHPSYIGDGTTGDANYWYIWDYEAQTYVRDAYAKGDDLHYDEMTPEEKEDLARTVLATLAFDQMPQDGSTNPVESQGVKNYVDAETSRATNAEATLQASISAETGRAQVEEQALQADITSEALARSSADTTLQTNINAEETRAKSAEQGLQDDIDAIEALIPSQATTSNQLADKEFVNSSIATATADFKGTYNSLEELEAVTADKNDYGYVVVNDAVGNTVYNRYKYNGTAWVFEYALNNSSFTAAEWAAIQSGITQLLVAKLAALPTNAELTAALNAKQDKLTFASVQTCEDIIAELI